MPQQGSQSSSALPAGYTLDPPVSQGASLPPGYTLDPPSASIPTEAQAASVPPVAPMPQKPAALRANNLVANATPLEVAPNNLSDAVNAFDPKFQGTPAQPYASIVPGVGAAKTYPRAIGGIVGMMGGAKLGGTLGPWGRDIGGALGAALGTGTGAAAEDIPSAWNSLKLKIPDEVKIPWTGIKVSRAQIPSEGHSVPIGPDAGEFYQNKGDDLVARGNAQDAIDRRAAVQQNKLQRAAQTAKDARDQAFNDRAQSMQMQQAYQDKLDAAKLKADNALARSQRNAQMQQGTDMSAEIEYNRNVAQQAAEAAEENRQRNLQASQAEDQRVQDLHDQFAKSLSDLESHRQKTLADQGRLNNQWGDALNRRGGASAAISPNAPQELQGNPTPFSPSFTADDIISRTRRLTIPDQELSAADIKKANDATNIKTDKLKQLARFGDMAAKNELNRRMKN